MAPLGSTFSTPCTAPPNEDPRPDSHSALLIRNVSVRGRRTSIRLEPQLWDTLAEICRREYCTLHDVCSYVAARRHGSLTSSLRVFILDYFRTSATEAGHSHAGHGQGMFLAQQQERHSMRKPRGDPPARPLGSDGDPQRVKFGPGPVE